MKYLLLVLLLCACCSASSGSAVCSPAQYDMLDWMTQNRYTTQYMTGDTGTNPRYEYIESNLHRYYDIKQQSGYPWDVNFFDTTADGYIYQWATENIWGDPTTYKAFDSTTTMPWTQRCVPIGANGQKLATIKLPSAPYHFYDTGCAKRTQQYDLGFVINEVWDNGVLSLGGNLPDNIHTLALSYRYTCDSNYDNCRYKEVFEYAQPLGLLRWTYYILSNGVYVQNNQTVHNMYDTLEDGPLVPVHPCWN
ncbi:MAG: hypothetical protein H0X25_01070 [Acidobacteriales bacterium]|nr:hypothetical protein [Terriglobales bacterium]